MKNKEAEDVKLNSAVKIISSQPDSFTISNQQIADGLLPWKIFAATLAELITLFKNSTNTASMDKKPLNIIYCHWRWQQCVILKQDPGF